MCKRSQISEPVIKFVSWGIYEWNTRRKGWLDFRPWRFFACPSVVADSRGGGKQNGRTRIGSDSLDSVERSGGRADDVTAPISMHVVQTSDKKGNVTLIPSAWRVWRSLAASRRS
jgi:hypothetical protein